MILAFHITLANIFYLALSQSELPMNNCINVNLSYIYIQYWSVDGKYRIYLTRLRNGVKDELLASLSPRFAPSQINSIFTVNRPILYLSCNPRCPQK